MSLSKLEKHLKNSENKNFINLTYEDFKRSLLRYANEHYSENIVDFSDASLGGMLLDFAAIVGDSLVYYAEQQFKELDYETATDLDNISRFIRKANIKNLSPSPSSVYVNISVEISIDTEKTSLNNYIPVLKELPVIKKGTKLLSQSGVYFSLIEDLDFTDYENISTEIGQVDSNDNPITLFMNKDVLCVSGNIVTEFVDFSNRDPNEFLNYVITNSNVTNILKIEDTNGIEYHEVDNLSQGYVFKKNKHNNENYISIKPAIYKFIKEFDITTNQTNIIFGNGNGKTLKDNVLVNPEDFLLPIYDNDYFSRLDVNIDEVLKSQTLGLSPAGSILQITYRYGGGIEHNVEVGTINIIDKLDIEFPNSDEFIIDQEIKQRIISSIEVINNEKAKGGSDAITLEQARNLIPLTLKSQSRIITYEDLIARIMTMPLEFGRVNKAVALDNLYNEKVKDIYVICKDSNGFYETASDSLKINLSKYLNEYRIIGDTYNIVDVPVYNFSINIKIKIKENYDPDDVIFEVSNNIFELMRFDSLEIGDSIDVNKIYRIVDNVTGVKNIVTQKQNVILCKSSQDNFYDFDLEQQITYSDNFFDPINNFNEGYVNVPRAGIFELKYSTININISN